MRKERGLALVFFSLLLIVVWIALSPAPAAVAEEPQVHVVRWGDTIVTIAQMYGITPQELVAANKLTGINATIYVGQQLTIPAPAQGGIVHVVAKGETLLAIAAQYNVTWWDLALRNGLTNMNLVWVGQRLIIPQKGTSALTPVPVARPTVPSTQEGILITQPTANGEITPTVTVGGWGSGYENTLAVDILDASGVTIGQGFATIDATEGPYGPFTGTLTVTMPSTAQLGRIQIYSIAARDGAIEHLASVTVKLQP